MKTWTWLDPDVLIALHDEQIEEHGGADGLRDRGLFESALARPQNLAAHQDPDAAVLAAAYAFGLAKNHTFADGNKRIALIALELFLDLNGFVLTADDGQIVRVVLSVASGAFTELELPDWIGENIAPL
jgi:death on curing protein